MDWILKVDLVDDPKSNNGYQIPNEGSYHFWIAKIGARAVFWPLNEEEYEAKKKEHGFEEEIVLKDVEDLK